MPVPAPPHQTPALAPSPEGRALLVRASRHPLAARVAARLGERCRVAADGSPLVVGTSGGADSTALLILLAALARRGSQRRPIHAVGIDHGLRREAAAELDAVERLAAALGVGWSRLTVAPAARPGNLAANARHDRYAALAAIARERGACAVAVAHHADDRLETMLLGLGRGRGLRGLAAPAWRRRLDGPVALVRPLLDITKDECVAFCAELGVDVATDPSNLDVRRARGALRTTVLPELLRRWPTLARHASRAADEAALAIRALDRVAAVHFGSRSVSAWTRQELRTLDRTLVAWGLRRAARSLDRRSAEATTARTWEQIATAVRAAADRPRRVAVGDRLELRIDATSVRFLHLPDSSP